MNTVNLIFDRRVIIIACCSKDRKMVAEDDIVAIRVNISEAEVIIEVSSRLLEEIWTSSVSFVIRVFESSVMESQSSSN